MRSRRRGRELALKLLYGFDLLPRDIDATLGRILAIKLCIPKKFVCSPNIWFEEHWLTKMKLILLRRMLHTGQLIV